MKKVFALVLLASLLASCSLFNTKTPQDGDTVSVDYVGTLDDGSEFDSSRKEGRSPIEFTIGSGGIIKGFEDAVRGMKVGSKKKVRIEAKDAYGEVTIDRTMPLSEYKETSTQTVPSDALIGVMEQKVPKDQVTQLFGTDKVGSEKKVGEASLKILSIQGEEILVSIDDPKAPFYKKKLAVGMSAKGQDGNLITITKVDGKNVTVDVKQEQEIISKTDKEITVRVKNPHPLAGKALNFEIELLEIKKPEPVTPAPTANVGTPEASTAMEKN